MVLTVALLHPAFNLLWPFFEGLDQVLPGGHAQDFDLFYVEFFDGQAGAEEEVVYAADANAEHVDEVDVGLFRGRR